MLASLGLAAFVAFLVAVATAGVIVVQKREAGAAAERIANLEREAAVARLETERLRRDIAPRNLSAKQRGELAGVLAPFKRVVGTVFASPSTQETEYFANAIGGALVEAGWSVFVQPGRTLPGALYTSAFQKNGHVIVEWGIIAHEGHAPPVNLISPENKVREAPATALAGELNRMGFSASAEPTMLDSPNTVRVIVFGR